jgi:hypothetical protein
MAYTIAVSTRETAEEFSQLLALRVKETTRFDIEEIEPPSMEALGVRAQERGETPRFLVCLRNIRLTKSKPYCGQHPGECVIERKKPKLAFLEWDDWIAFNDLVNDVLDEMKVHAEVWSRPHEPALRGQSRKRFWIRKAGRRRVHWDWEEEPMPFGPNVIRRWDMGSEGQFAREGDAG